MSQCANRFMNGYSRDTSLCRLEVKQNETGVKGFVPQAKRWVVERTSGWFTQARRLVRE